MLINSLLCVSGGADATDAWNRIFKYFNDYLINLANLKGHSLAGVSLTAKNHFGTIFSKNPAEPSFSSPMAAGLHPYVAVHDFHQGGHWDFDAREMDTYNPLVDIMGHKELGAKMLVYLLDGLYVPRNQYEKMTTDNKWQSAPFYGDWTSSIFLSLEPVAIESVGVDFLKIRTGTVPIGISKFIKQ